MAYPTPVSSEIEIEIENHRSPATTIDSSFASASSSSTAGSGDPMVYDVFLNHRGPDTKTNFALRLYRRLLSHGFRAFLDQHELEGGFNFPSQIVEAIRSASVHVAIFSPTYAESPWCLNELLLMLESKKPIIPVFYKVMPAKLRYAEALLKLETKTTYDPQTDSTRPRYDSATIQNWRNALSTVADISGFDLEGAFNSDEIHLLDKVVECVMKRVKKKQLYVAKYPTGLNEKVEDFETRVLKQHQHSGKVQVVGIVGLGGMGKTTLALELFNRKSSNYNKSYFLADVRENAKSSSLHLLQSKVLRGLTQSELNIDNIYEGTEKLKNHLRSSHVLLILDDIDQEDHLDAFLPVQDVLHPDSLILITSRDKDVLIRAGVKESSIYKLTGLSTQHSQELFCSYAFCQAYPLKGFEDLVNKFLMSCQGLPLSLRVFGALLFGKNERSFWEDKLCQVHEVPNDIQKRLTVSYNSLHEKEQQIFLDIACFFIGEKRDITVGIWDERGWNGSSGFQNLESKCLVEVDSDNCIHMHDHLRDLGREIALDKLPRRLCRPTENSDDLLQPSCNTLSLRLLDKLPRRLCLPTDNRYDLLQPSSNEQGLTEVRGIRMFLENDSDHWYSRNPPSMYWSGSFGRRQLFQWGRRRLFQWGQKVFVNRVMKLQISLHNTCYRILGIGVMKLQVLQTSGHLLERILRRVHSPNLIWLSWHNCPYSYLPTWIPMKNLRVLKLKGKELETLWQGRSQTPFQLRELEISGTILKIPKSIGQLKHLERIFFESVSFEKLPEEFCNLRSLKVLVLKERYSSLKALPDSFGNLTNLQHMELLQCNTLERLPESLGNLRNLQHMELRCWMLERLPKSLCKLTKLQKMKLVQCNTLKRLPECLGNLRNLQHMVLRCWKLERLPESLCKLTKLQKMKLLQCNTLKRLPESLGNLTNLQNIYIRCKKLERLPESLGILTNLQRMELSFCVKLERLPESLGILTNLQRMELRFCVMLKRLPKSLGNLTNLEIISMRECKKLKRLPNMKTLVSLTKLQAFGCLALEELNGVEHCVSLVKLEAAGCPKLKSTPDLAQLTKLESLDVSGCLALQKLNGVEQCKSLVELNVSTCVKLKSTLDLAQLTKLRLLDVSGCLALEKLNGVEHCVSLVKLKAAECPKLKWGAGVLNKLRQQKCDCIVGRVVRPLSSSHYEF